MQAAFSIWWVISIGCLFLFVLAALLRQRRNLIVQMRPQVVQRENVQPNKKLTELPMLPQFLDRIVDVKAFGFSPLYVHDLRGYTPSGSQTLSQMPEDVTTALRKAYDEGHAYGPEVLALLKGGSIEAGKHLYFALIEAPDIETRIAFMK